MYDPDSAKLLYVSGDNPIVDIKGEVPQPGYYVLVANYYQPDESSRSPNEKKKIAGKIINHAGVLHSYSFLFYLYFSDFDLPLNITYGNPGEGTNISSKMLIFASRCRFYEDNFAHIISTFIDTVKIYHPFRT